VESSGLDIFNMNIYETIQLESGGVQWTVHFNISMNIYDTVHPESSGVQWTGHFNIPMNI